MPFGEEHTSTPVVTVDGRPLPEDVAALLESVVVDDSRAVPDLFVLTFTDDRGLVASRAGVRIGSTVSVSVQSSGPGGPVPLLDGEVTALDLEVTADGVRRTVRGYDRSHRLFRGRRVEAYLDCTAGDVVRTVAGRAGMRTGRIRAGLPVVPHITQDGVSDGELLWRLAREHGCVVAVRDGALSFDAPTASRGAPSGAAGSRREPLVLEHGANLLTLRATLTAADQVPEVQVRGWDVAAKREVVGTASAGTTSATVDGTTPGSLASLFAGVPAVVPAPGLGTAARVGRAAEALADRIGGGFAELDGVARGNPRLRAGEAVALTGVGTPFDGRYTLSATRHELTPEDGYLTSFTVSGASERSLYGVVTGGTAADAPVLPGVVNAVVTNTKDPESLGRVKIKVPVLSDRYESGWARVVHLGAGAGRGLVLQPEVGDEVLVAFAQDDLQQPYVLGGLFNGKDKPDRAWGEHVHTNDGAVVRRAMVSRTGMLLELKESPDGEELTLSTNDGKQRITLTQKQQAGITIAAEGPVSVTAQKDVEVTTSNGAITLKGRTVTLDATSDLVLKGTNVTVDAKAAAEVKGATAKVAAQGTAELSASGITTVKGAMVKIN